MGTCCNPYSVTAPSMHIHPQQLCNLIKTMRHNHQNELNLHKQTHFSDAQYFRGTIDSNNHKTGYGEYFKGNMQYYGMFKDNLLEGYGLLINKTELSKQQIKQQTYTDKNETQHGQIKQEQQQFIWEYYIGNFHQNKCHGQGKQVRTKLIFKGQFVNGQRNYGNLKTQEYQYEGHFKNNKFDGKGTIIFKNNFEYTGQFKNGKIQGIGIYHQSNKRQMLDTQSTAEKDIQYYEGRFHHGKMHGYGTYKWKNGASYDGEYMQGHKHGYGKFKHQNIEFAGYWKNGKQQGQGIVYGQGDSIFGDWKNGDLELR